MNNRKAIIAAFEKIPVGAKYGWYLPEEEVTLTPYTKVSETHFSYSHTPDIESNFAELYNQVGWSTDHVPKTKEEKMLDHDPEFPFVVLSAFGDTPIAKFASRNDTGLMPSEYRDRIIDTTPKPLPTEPGIYVREDADLQDASNSAVFYIRSGLGSWMSDETGEWMSDETGEWMNIEESEVPTDLVPLVKGTR